MCLKTTTLLCGSLMFPGFSHDSLKMFLSFLKECFTTPLITECTVQAKGVRAAEAAPSVSKISLKRIDTISLSNYFIQKLYQRVFYISWSTVGVGKSDRGCGRV